MLVERGDWIALGSADEQKPAKEDTVEAWGRAPRQPGRRLVRAEEGHARTLRDVPPAAARGARPGRARAQRAQQPHARDLSLAGRSARMATPEQEPGPRRDPPRPPGAPRRDPRARGDARQAPGARHRPGLRQAHRRRHDGGRRPPDGDRRRPLARDHARTHRARAGQARRRDLRPRATPAAGRSSPPACRRCPTPSCACPAPPPSAAPRHRGGAERRSLPVRRRRIDFCGSSANHKSRFDLRASRSTAPPGATGARATCPRCARSRGRRRRSAGPRARRRRAGGRRPAATAARVPCSRATRSMTLPPSSTASLRPGGKSGRPSSRRRRAIAGRACAVWPENHCIAPTISHAQRIARAVLRGCQGGGKSGLQVASTSCT